MLHYKELFPLGPFGSKMPAWCPATPSTSVSVSDTKGHVLGGHTVTVKIGTYARPVTHLTLSFHSCPSSADVLDVCVSCPLALFTGGCSSFLTLETCHLGEQRLAHVQRAPSPSWGLPGVSGLESGACPGPAQCVRGACLRPWLWMRWRLLWAVLWLKMSLCPLDGGRLPAPSTVKSLSLPLL